LSSTEAEYIALLDYNRQCVWIRSTLLELGYNFGLIPINGDNQGSIFMSSNPVTESRNKYIDIHYHASVINCFFELLTNHHGKRGQKEL